MDRDSACAETEMDAKGKRWQRPGAGTTWLVEASRLSAVTAGSLRVETKQGPSAGSSGISYLEWFVVPKETGRSEQRPRR